MKRSCAMMIICVLPQLIVAQQLLKVIVYDKKTAEPLTSASVIFLELNKGKATDSTGAVNFQDLPKGLFTIEVSSVGYTSLKQKIVLPFQQPVLELRLETNEEEDDDLSITVTATRTDRSVRNTPTRVEVIAGSEIAESTSMRPGEIRMLLNETTGINTQQTSAISSTANIRIQELEGRYTQILRDGFPLYSGLSEGLSLVQIAPLDLQQVEIIKGSSSTLYGGGAIAGLINLVSKTPSDKREISFLVNGTSTGGLDISGFYSKKFRHTGLTVFASKNSGQPYDPSGIGLTAIPKFDRYTITPRLFITQNKTAITISTSYITEERVGGNIKSINDGTAGYIEKNNSNRFVAQLDITHNLNDGSWLRFKNSYNHFGRSIAIPDFMFAGLQQASFSELSWNKRSEKWQWVTGLNLYADNFKEAVSTTYPSRSYQYITSGGFVQNTWSASNQMNIESGVRIDYTKPYGFALLPRLSLLFRFSDMFTSRIGGGIGYKLPTIFTEESEEQQFQNILPLQKLSTQYERSTGGNIDFTFKKNFNNLHLTINPLFFYTRINHPLQLSTTQSGMQEFKNANGYADSKGVDISLRLSIDELKFFTGYSYTVVQNHFNGLTSTYPLAPKQKLHFDLVYEVEGKLRLAFESYYTGEQLLTDGTTGKHYWLFGFLIEKSWKHFSLFINGEDLNDARQTKWSNIFSGSIDHPVFKDVYTPLEGRTINGGVKIKL